MNMKKNGILTAVMVLLCITAVAPAADGELGVEAGVSWVTKYLWHGYDLLDDKPALQPSVTVDLFDTGFSVGYFGSYGTTAKRNGTVSTVNAYENRYIVSYAQSFFEGEQYQTDATANWIYYDFYRRATKVADAQEAGVELAFPKICPHGVVPSYYVGAIWPDKSTSLLGANYSGWIHVFSLAYGLTVPGFLPETPEQVLDLVASAVYNDGFANGATTGHDWSHATFGVSTDIDLGNNVVFTPAVYYQSSWEDAVNTEDELFASFGVSYRFK